jgi:hypothetical protein
MTVPTGPTGPTGPMEPTGPMPTAEDGRVERITVERCGWMLAWLAVLIAGIGLWGTWTSWSWGGAVAPAVVVLGIVGMAATWLLPSPRAWWFQLSGLAAVAAAILGQQGASTHVRGFYSTDSGAFNQVAARLVLHGINPYRASMAPAGQLLQTPSEYWTYLVDGGHVSHVSYPAGSFLLDVPALALGFHHLVVDWMDLFAWVLTGVLVYLMLPAALRWFAVLLLAVPTFSSIFGSGGTDAVFLPFVVVAVWRWDRFATGRGAGLARWIGPFALGLACSIKQSPWFCVPFLVLGIALEARATGRRPLRTAAAYLGIVVGVFVLVNLPFFVWGPRLWVRGVLLPFTHPLVIDGQGLGTLVLHGVSRGVSMPLLTAAGVLVLVALLVALAVWYPWMKRVWLLLVPLCFVVATRSLSTYLIDFAPAAVVAAVSVSPVVLRRPGAPAGHRRRRTPGPVVRGAAVAVPGLVAVFLAVLAFGTPPLDLAVDAVHTSSKATVLDTVTVTVRNETDQTVVPHFVVTITSGHPDGFWTPTDGRRVVIGPHGSTRVTLAPPRETGSRVRREIGAPNHGTHWLVGAYTASPEALSTTGLLFWKLGKPPMQTP